MFHFTLLFSASVFFLFIIAMEKYNLLQTSSILWNLKQSKMVSDPFPNPSAAGKPTRSGSQRQAHGFRSTFSFWHSLLSTQLWPRKGQCCWLRAGGGACEAPSVRRVSFAVFTAQKKKNKSNKNLLKKSKESLVNLIPQKSVRFVPSSLVGGAMTSSWCQRRGQLHSDAAGGKGVS